MTIRLLYGLTKEALRAMRRPELDDVARRLQSTAEDAAGQLGKKNQGQFDATKKAVDQEKRTRQIRDEEYSIMQQEEKALNEWIPTEDIARGVGSLARREGGTELPEFTSSNLSKISREELGETGTYAQWMSRGSPIDDWWGRKVMSETQPGKYANIKLENLNQAQQDVYKVIRDMKSYGDLPQELGHPGVLADLLDEAGRAGEKIYRYQGDGAKMFVSNYWRKKGPMIRKNWDAFESGDVPTGTSFDDIAKGRYNNPNAGD